jgi:hypothetical protein
MKQICIILSIFLSVNVCAQGNGVRIEQHPVGMLVKVNYKPVFFYHTKEAMPPADSPSYYRRSGFIHPLYSPNGSILTDDFPAGHAHQHGIFTAWTNTTFKGKMVDFWNQHKKLGTVEHVQVLEVKDGPGSGRIKTKLRHVSLEHGPVLEEIWTITIYPHSDYFLFDLESEQVNITSDTLTLNKYLYGGLGIRGSKQWNSHDTANFKNEWNLLTSEGIQGDSANHTHVKWVDVSGMLDEKMSGLTVFTHPSNFRYPQAIRVHPEMPYWAYAPVVDGEFKLAPGKTYKSRFRFFVHEGAPDRKVIEKIMKEWK